LSRERGAARRALLVPEVVQASALDCGPAALAALLAGYGLGRPFEELRQACRTGRDGTSIDALEAVAGEMGLEAEQVVVPVDQVTVPAGGCVPCILVVTRPGGAAHFVVLWRVAAGRAQVMDPAAGRRWPAVAALEREIYRHRAVVPAAAWRAWAGSGEAVRLLDGRLGALGIGGGQRQALLQAAAGRPGWRGLAALDAAVRFAGQLVGAGGVRRGREAARLLDGLLDGGGAEGGGAEGGWAEGGANREMVPPDCWTVRPAAGGGAAGGGGRGGSGGGCEEEGMAGGGNGVSGGRGRSGASREAEGVSAERLLVEGAVLVRVRGLKPGCRGAGHGWAVGGGGGRRWALAGRALPGGLPRHSAGGGAASATPVPGRAVDGERPAAAVGKDGSGWTTLVLASGGAALGRLVEAAVLVAALELLPAVASRRLGVGLLGWLVILGGAVLLFEMAASGSAMALGRRGETVVRLRLAAKLPRLPDRYLRTRLLADLAERAHLLTEVRRGPRLGAAALRAGLDVVLAAVGIAWLDGRLAAAALATGLAALVVPALLLPRCEERGRRVRAHAAALGGLSLDLLRGLAAVRAHAADSVFRRRHDELLAAWLRARRGADAAGRWLEVVTQAVLSLAAALLVLAHARRHGLDPRALVLVLWAVQLVGGGQRLALLAGRELPLHRGLRRRIAEPLAAAEEDEAPAAGGAGAVDGGVAASAGEAAAGGGGGREEGHGAAAAAGRAAVVAGGAAMLAGGGAVVGGGAEVQAGAGAASRAGSGAAPAGRGGGGSREAGRAAAPAVGSAAEAGRAALLVDGGAVLAGGDEVSVGGAAARVGGAVIRVGGAAEVVGGEDVAARGPERVVGVTAGGRSRAAVGIVLERVTVAVEGRALLREVELAIPGGQHVAVLGGSGAGKSTLLGTLLGWHRAAAGRVLVDGRPLDAREVAELRRATAWVAPEVALWRGSVLENLCYGNDGGGCRGAPRGEAAWGGTGATRGGAALELAEAPRAAPGTAAMCRGEALAPVEALRAALLLELVPRLSEGLQTPLGEAGGRLSGGEGQRLRLARALLRPGVRLALLDEAFRGLGADQRRQLLAAARERWRQATLVCVTHSPAEAGGFDRLLVLAEGRLVEDGAPEVLAGRPGSRYRCMLEAEARAGAALRSPVWRQVRLADGVLWEVGAGRAAATTNAANLAGADGAAEPVSGGGRAEVAGAVSAAVAPGGGAEVAGLVGGRREGWQ
jgi:ABC-type bacteriocin/lantibiotic exporter with double-glycine peptidase domain